LENTEIRDFIVFGDWHSNSKYATHAIARAMNTFKPDIFLHVGDFGLFKHREDYLKLVEEKLSEVDRELWFVDGNHEDFEMLKNYPYDFRGLQKITEHVYRIPRGYSWTWSGKKFVGLGGAHSVDMLYREAGVSWWPDELILEEDFQKTISHGSADFMLSHEAPWLPYKILKEPSMFNSITPESEYLSRVCRDFILQSIEILQPSVLVHGHHHRSYEESYKKTRVVGLDRDGKDFSKNLAYFKIEKI